MKTLWASGWVRLALLALVIGGVGEAIAATDRAPAPTRAERAATEKARLATLDRNIARVKAAQGRDPAVRRERARLRAQQRPHADRALPGTRSRAAQGALVTALERSITRDANRRFRARELDKPTLETACVHLVRPQVLRPPPPPLSAKQAGYECTAATVKLRTNVSRTGTAILGFPFWARVNFRTGSYTWCKINLVPSEHGIGDQLAFVPLAPVCDLLKQRGPA
jgi:hypothetical protein